MPVGLFSRIKGAGASLTGMDGKITAIEELIHEMSVKECKSMEKDLATDLEKFHAFYKAEVEPAFRARALYNKQMK